MFYVYCIRSQVKNWIYTGITQDLETRLDRHNKGGEKTTRPHRPFTLIHVEIAKNRQEARKIEKFLKSSTGKDTLKSTI